MAKFELYVSTARRWLRAAVPANAHGFIVDGVRRGATIVDGVRSTDWLDDWVEESTTNRYRWDVLNLLAQEKLALGEGLRAPLAAWVRDVLADQYVKQVRKKRRPRPRKGSRRDALLCEVICRLTIEFPELLPTRHVDKDSERKERRCSVAGGTACDVAGLAYAKECGTALAYKTVEEIWNSRPWYMRDATPVLPNTFLETGR